MELLISLIDRAAKLCGSQSKLAETLHVDRSLVTVWKKGVALPSEVQVARMAELVGVRLEDALLARSEAALSKTPEGQRLIGVMRGGFLRGVAAIFSTSATPAADDAMGRTFELRSTKYASYLSRLRAYRSKASKLLPILGRVRPAPGAVLQPFHLCAV